MPAVLAMQQQPETNNWGDDARVMLGNGGGSDISSLTGSIDGRGIGGTMSSANVVSRSQDDARVGYFFQRPQAVLLNQQLNNKRWMGDDGFAEQARTVTDLEREFHRLAFENPEEDDPTLKMWTSSSSAVNVNRSSAGMDGNLSDSALNKATSSSSAGMFHLASLPNNPWLSREDFWGGTQSDSTALSDLIHTTTISHRRPGSFPGSADLASVVSSNCVDNLGVNMAEYVLGTSPGITGVKVGDDSRRQTSVSAAVTLRYIGGGDADGRGAVGPVVVDKSVLSSYSGIEHTSNKEQEQDGSSALHMNGVMQNGLDEKNFCRAPGSRQNSPTEADPHHHPHHQQQSHRTSLTSAVAGNNSSMETMSGCGMLSSAGAGGAGMNYGTIDAMGIPHMANLTLDVPPPAAQMELMGYDPFQQQAAIYPNHLIHGLGQQPMDSPNFNIDYNQMMFGQQQQAARQQQQAAAAGGPGAAAIGPPQMNMMIPPPAQQQFTALPTDQLMGQPMVPQFYNVQPSWPVYPPQAAAMMQQQRQQQQQLQSSGQQTPTGPGTPQPHQQLLRSQLPTRPLTPQQQQQQIDAMNAIQTPGTPAGYQVLTPAFYDQNGQLFMNSSRQVGHVVRLVSPGPPTVLMTGGQQGFAPSAYTPSVSTGMMTPRATATPVFINQQQALNPNNPANNQPGTTVNIAPIGQGLVQTRRDSFGSGIDLKQITFAGAPAAFNQWYSGTSNLSPGGAFGITHTMTPPPQLAANNPQLILPGLGLTAGGVGPGRLYSAAPGAEAKYRNGSLTLNPAPPGAAGLFGTSLFSQQNFSKSDGISRDVAAGRSQLLEDFRNNRMPNLQLRDLVDHVVEFSQDQHGSRFIQQKLEHANASEKLMVFNEILTSAYSLMTDVFGNYVIQKFLEFGTQEQKQMLTQRVRGHVLSLALHMYGCRVIQKALESVPLEMQVDILKELEGHVLKCVKDQNGNHVVQKCIECIEPTHLTFITESFKGQVLNLAMHPYGCRVIQRILEHCTSEQIACIMDELREHTEHLVFDQYGNYVIQHVLEHGKPDDKTLIINQLRGKILALSQHKFASNVIEKCVSHSSRPERALIIEEVCNMNDGTNSALYTMMKDQFANYVVQKMIDLADPTQRKLLLTKIRPHVATLRKYAYGKHILAKLEKFYVKNNAELGPIGVNPLGTSINSSSA